MLMPTDLAPHAQVRPLPINAGEAALRVMVAMTILGGLSVAIVVHLLTHDVLVALASAAAAIVVTVASTRLGRPFFSHVAPGGWGAA